MWLMVNDLLFSFRECCEFMLLCLELLSDHLSLATAAGAPAGILGEHVRPLRHLLFRLLDATVSDDLQEVRQISVHLKVHCRIYLLSFILVGFKLSAVPPSLPRLLFDLQTVVINLPMCSDCTGSE